MEWNVLFWKTTVVTRTLLYFFFPPRICLSSHEERLGRKGTCEAILKSLKAESRGRGRKCQKSEEKEIKKSIEKISVDSKKLDGDDIIKTEESKVNAKNSFLPEDKEIKSADMDILSPDLSNDEKPNFNFTFGGHATFSNETEENNEVINNEITDEVRQNDCSTKTDKIPGFIEGLMKLQDRDEAIAKIRNGWHLENSHSLSLGDVYLMVNKVYK